MINIEKKIFDNQKIDNQKIENTRYLDCSINFADFNKI